MPFKHKPSKPSHSRPSNSRNTGDKGRRTKARKPTRKSTTAISADPSLQRINKVLAAAGLGSRREVEELILQGRVEVDGQTVSNLATRVDPSTAKIQVDGQTLKQSKLVYYALNKPKGILSTNNDPSGRMRVIDFVPDKHRVFSVGRLDQNSEGLILLTNDGDLAQRLAHPKFRVQKTYFVVVAGILTREELAKLRKGVYLAEGVARIDGARIRKTRKTCTELEILLSEGKNREIRRILARAGHKVVLLRRIAIGPLRLAELPVGAVRELTTHEIQALFASTEQAHKPRRSSDSNKIDRTTNRPTVASPANAKCVESEEALVEKIVTPIENDQFDDFGLGLEQDYQYDPSQLVLSDDAEEFGDGDDWDDDFGGDYESLATGSVLSYDEEQATPGNRDRGHQRDRESGSSRRPAKNRQSGPRRSTDNRSSAPGNRSKRHSRSEVGRPSGIKTNRGGQGRRPVADQRATGKSQESLGDTEGSGSNRQNRDEVVLERRPRGRKPYGGRPLGSSGGTARGKFVNGKNKGTGRTERRGKGELTEESPNLGETISNDRNYGRSGGSRIARQGNRLGKRTSQKSYQGKKGQGDSNNSEGPSSDRPASNRRFSGDRTGGKRRGKGPGKPRR